MQLQLNCYCNSKLWPFCPISDDIIDISKDSFLLHGIAISPELKNILTFIIFYFSDVYKPSRQNYRVLCLMPDNEIPPNMCWIVPICACGVQRGPPERIGIDGLVTTKFFFVRYNKPIPIRGDTFDPPHRLVPTKIFGIPAWSWVQLWRWRQQHNELVDVVSSSFT